MAVAVILIFWTAQFTTVTISRLVRMPEESLSFIEPRAVVTACAILLSFGILAVLRAVRGWTLLKRALIAAGLAVVGCCIHTLVNMIVFMLFSFFVADYSFTDYLIAFAVSVFDFVWFYSALSVMLLALTYGEDLVENEDRIASLEAQANIAQLNALRYQLNPHFLFNTLNSVASLISKQMGAEAETMVVSLSDFLRSTLRMDSGREITLAEEIKLQSLYLDIEKARFPRTAQRHHRRARAFARRLRAQSDHPAADRECDQARRRPSSAPVHLEVIARDTGGKLSLEIRDDGGNASDAPAPGTKVGLRNVAERLKLRYGDEGSLVAGRRPEGGFSARILIPLRRA